MSAATVAASPAGGSDDAALTDILDRDAAFQQALAFAVAARYLAVKPTMARDPAPFPAGLVDAMLWAIADYERAVKAQWQGRRGRSLADLARTQAAVDAARRKMRYRVTQGLMHLGLGMFVDWDEFPAVRGWQPHDGGEDHGLNVRSLA